ncbi:MFS transporter [Kribbella albertanoniae]|uniref:DHA2 family efflux MFS transporter permease subunit n=1 Tax=Kribbella albertanoniae TaxID=1266829 RepID=A0A4R4PRP8_9ACTN|nr:DHA2 family efflux MFS transporter permease subunit [Kribbella albertanoniae]TDC25007.1 DHA2 family efflux MFS transporter permease subunit [Kribbella albertanoniae]
MYATTDTLATTPATQGGRSRWLALYTLCAGMLMIVLDVTVVNVALPAIQDDLGFTSSSLAWVVNAYLIAFGGLLLLAGRLGDLLGRRNIFIAGLVVFTVASVWCGLASSQEVLVIARFVQGIGGALTSAVILGMIVTLFPEPREQAKAIGMYAFVASAGGSIGLLAGGVLTQAISWHWIFFVNLPIGILTVALALKLIEKDKGLGMGRGTDVPGAVLITAALMLGVFTIVKPAAELGWTAGRTVALGLLTLTLLICFVVREATAANPLVPLRIFRSRNLSGANLVQALSASGMFGIFFLGSLYLQRVLGYDALEIGLAFLPTTVVMGLLSVRYSEKLVTRFGPRRPLIAGLLLVTLGLVLFTQAPVDGNYVVHVLPVLALLGLGGGIAFPALMGLSMADVQPEDAGLASGLIGTMGEVGAALGLAVLATLAATNTTGSSNPLQALTNGYHFAFAVAAAILAVSVLIAYFVMRPAKTTN